jgi:hypothetical protein
MCDQWVSDRWVSDQWVSDQWVSDQWVSDLSRIQVIATYLLFTAKRLENQRNKCHSNGILWPLQKALRVAVNSSRVAGPRG